MTVYVDNMRARYGQLVLCHMIADTEAELHAMADRIGVERRWYQQDHYDVCLAKRALAVTAGAVEITWRQTALMMSDRRRDPAAPLVPLEVAEARVQAHADRVKQARAISDMKQRSLL